MAVPVLPWLKQSVYSDWSILTVPQADALWVQLIESLCSLYTYCTGPRGCQWLLSAVQAQDISDAGEDLGAFQQTCFVHCVQQADTTHAHTCSNNLLVYFEGNALLPKTYIIILILVLVNSRTEPVRLDRLLARFTCGSIVSDGWTWIYYHRFRAGSRAGHGTQTRSCDLLQTSSVSCYSRSTAYILNFMTGSRNLSKQLFAIRWNCGSIHSYRDARALAAQLCTAHSYQSVFYVQWLH